MPEPTSASPAPSPTTESTSCRGVVLALLGRCLFVRASELVARTVMVSRYGWPCVLVGVGQRLRCHIDKERLRHLQENGCAAVLRDIKVALFNFLLRIVNRRPQASFFDNQNIEATPNRVNRERERLARKRSRAAMRERIRE